MHTKKLSFFLQKNFQFEVQFEVLHVSKFDIDFFFEWPKGLCQLNLAQIRVEGKNLTLIIF